MKVIIKPRRAGKTREIAEAAIKNQGIVLTVDKERTRLIERNYPALKGRVHTFDYFYRDTHRGTFMDKIYIDDLDEVLHYAFGYHTISGVSFTGVEGTGWDT